MTIASAKTLEEASKTAPTDMVNLLTEETTLSHEEAYALLGAIAHLKIGNVVDPEATVRVAVPKTCSNRHTPNGLDSSPAPRQDNRQIRLS